MGWIIIQVIYVCTGTEPTENEFPSWNQPLAFTSPFGKLNNLMNASTISSKSSLCLLCQIKAERKSRERRKKDCSKVSFGFKLWHHVLHIVQCIPNIRRTVREKSVKGRMCFHQHLSMIAFYKDGADLVCIIYSITFNHTVFAVFHKVAADCPSPCLGLQFLFK